jgi:hypothetical protein
MTGPACEHAACQIVLQRRIPAITAGRSRRGPRAARAICSTSPTGWRAWPRRRAGDLSRPAERHGGAHQARSSSSRWPTTGSACASCATAARFRLLRTRSTLCWPRRCRGATTPGSASPRGGRPAEPDDELADRPVATGPGRRARRRQGRPGRRNRTGRAGRGPSHHRRRVVRRRLAAEAIATTTGIRRVAGCELVAYCWLWGPTTRRPASLGRAFDARHRCRRPRRPTGWCAYSHLPPPGRLTVVPDLWVTAQPPASWPAPQREEVIKARRSPTWAAGVALLTRSKSDDLLWGDARRRRGTAARPVPPAGRRAAGFPHSTWTAGAGVPSTCRPRGANKTTPTAGCRAVSLAPGTADPGTAAADLTALRRRCRLNRGQPGVGRPSTGAEGPRSAAGRCRAVARPHHRLHPAADAARRGGGGSDLTWLPMPPQA